MVAINKKAVLCLGLLSLGMVHPAAAEDGAPITVEGSVAFVTNYRFRGISVSDNDGAVQAGMTVSTESGLYGSIWGSSIESLNGSEMETNYVVGYASETDSGLSYDVGTLLYAYPGGTDTNYYEFYGSLGKSFEQFSASVGFAYNPSQSNIGGTDNLYLYSNASYEVADAPFSLNGHFGYEDGAFGDGKLDWSLGLGTSYNGLEFGISYVDTNIHTRQGKGGVVFSVGASF